MSIEQERARIAKKKRLKGVYASIVPKLSLTFKEAALYAALEDAGEVNAPSTRVSARHV